MAIIFDQVNSVFTLQTSHSMYQMKVDEHGVLLHTYYGRKGIPFDYSYLITYADHGFSGNPYDVGDNRLYSLDALPQEYPVYGSGDHRSTALKVQYADGAGGCELRYVRHELRKGKYSLPGLPALYDSPGTASHTLVITLEDSRKVFYVHLYYGVMENLDLITRSVCVENRGGDPLYLEQISSVCVDFQHGDYDLHTFWGRHLKERTYQRTPVTYGTQAIGSTRGASSHQHNPFFLLTSRQASEDTGDCYGFSFLYSGDFLAAAHKDQYSQTRVLMGIHPDNFRYCLYKGDCFYAPEAAMAYSGQGMNALSQIYHKAYRHNLCRGAYKTARRPILLNSWEGVYFDFNAEKLMNMARKAAQLGIELFVLDDGWFGKRSQDISGLGDWYVNENKLGCGLKELSDEIHALGMQFGIWFEPECVNEDSNLYREHPDWALKVPGKAPTRSRYQLVLDFSREDVREHIFGKICQVLDSAQIEYLKWDFNRSISDIYSAKLPPKRQGETAHRYILGLYDMLEKLTERYPNLLLEGCSGGGGRFDAGMLYYTPQIWCSDDTDAIERLSIQYGTSFGYPISTAGAHVSHCPNEQTGRMVPLETRAAVAMAGTFGYELDPGKITKTDRLAIQKQIKEFQKYYDLIQDGLYYRLTNPDDYPSYHGWEFVKEDGSEALLCIVALHVQPNASRCCMKLKGLKEDKIYLIDGVKYPGSALMHGGYLIPHAKVEYESFRIHVTEWVE